jgi:hypothetical protein
MILEAFALLFMFLLLIFSALFNLDKWFEGRT